MTVVYAMLGNAAVAAGLALLAVAVGCAVRSPAVRHAAWLLVLLKLVTPPLFGIPLAVLPASWAPPTSAGNPEGQIRNSKSETRTPAARSAQAIPRRPVRLSDFGFRISDLA